MGRCGGFRNPHEFCSSEINGVSHRMAKKYLLWRHIGHCSFDEACLIHSKMQCFSKSDKHIRFEKDVLNLPHGNYDRKYQTLFKYHQLLAAHLMDSWTHAVYNHLLDICMLDRFHRSPPGRYHRHHPLRCPISMSRRRSTFWLWLSSFNFTFSILRGEQSNLGQSDMKCLSLYWRISCRVLWMVDEEVHCLHKIPVTGRLTTGCLSASALFARLQSCWNWLEPPPYIPWCSRIQMNRAVKKSSMDLRSWVSSGWACGWAYL